LATMFKSQNSFRAFSRLPCAPVLAGFTDLPRERHPSEPCVLTPAAASPFPVFSGGLASVREGTSCIGAGLGAAGCGWQLL
jgi:hypothetical protein